MSETAETIVQVLTLAGVVLLLLRGYWPR
jgi:hypothetical protein